ncbi:hypothetical protein QBC47DRAFT_302927 [Echria macrotheca]|uniref:N-acetyltransferase domain-containing protein n=1 Tax=Echria macrotheca TaxID=438768 RepID=A0AAJ0BCB7_9PEZI|nr:hypothetical protein QBC47DRAFT_302927 [Echria macrotheca]
MDLIQPRLGRSSDIDAVTKVFVRAMPLDPQWEYRFPLRDDYPDDHLKYSRMLIKCFLEYDDWTLIVTEDSLEPGSKEKTVVAFAVLDVSYKNKRLDRNYRTQDRKYPTLLPASASQLSAKWVEGQGGSTRRDANHDHFNAFWKQQVEAYEKYFSHIGNDQIHLQILATMPKFHRRGHGSSLCRWATDLVINDSLRDMSVMASPMGRLLYGQLGFQAIGTFYIQVPGEAEKLTLEAMMWCPSQPARTASRGA